MDYVLEYTVNKIGLNRFVKMYKC